MGYPRERKEAVLKKMLPPCSKPISEIAKEEGISDGHSVQAARAEGRLTPEGDTNSSDQESSNQYPDRK